MKYLLGIDLGTSGTKTVLFNELGKPIASKTLEYPMEQPQNGWAEQNPKDWWNATVEGIKSVLEHSSVDSNNIAGIGISGQMHGLVMLDQNGEVLRPSIIWCDGRTTKECEEINALVGEKRLIEITANPALTGFTASKILWVRKNEPDIYAKCAKILLPKDYIRYMLTGDFATEVSDASGMQLLDVPNRCWSDEILEKLNIDKSLLGDVFESCEVTGNVHKVAATLTGLAEGTIVVGGAGDNAAAAIGTGVVSSGKAFTTIGTSGVVFAHADDVSIDLDGRVHTFCSAVPGKWTVMSCTQAAGLSLRWLRDNVCTDIVEQSMCTKSDSYIMMTKLAETTPIGAEKLLFLPYLMGERSPHLNPNARGVFFGLSAMHTKAHMIRAVMEGVAYSQLDCINVFRQMGVKIDHMMSCGGGARSPLWRQMLADMYGCEVSTLQADEGPALGVAILAGVGAGIYDSVEQACKTIVIKGTVQQNNLENGTQYDKFYKLYKNLYCDLKKDFEYLSKI